MKGKKVAIAIGLLGIVGSAIMACSPNSQNSSTAQLNPNSKLRSVAITVGDLSNPFFVLMGRGAESEAKKIGGAGVHTAVVSSGYDLNLQFNQIENFIAAKTDLILLNASSRYGRGWWRRCYRHF